MKRETAIEYIGHHVDDAGSPHAQPITDCTKLVGWQCGFETMFVAVHSYLNCACDDDEAKELATDYLCEIGWFGDDIREPDFIM